ncbi:MAG: hypothetical protein ACFFDW_16470 [Candidatus Thorarchaeota archaeon]
MKRNKLISIGLFLVVFYLCQLSFINSINAVYQIPLTRRVIKQGFSEVTGEYYVIHSLDWYVNPQNADKYKDWWTAIYLVHDGEAQFLFYILGSKYQYTNFPLQENHNEEGLYYFRIQVYSKLWYSSLENMWIPCTIYWSYGISSGYYFEIP